MSNRPVDASPTLMRAAHGAQGGAAACLRRDHATVDAEPILSAPRDSMPSTGEINSFAHRFGKKVLSDQ